MSKVGSQKWVKMYDNKQVISFKALLIFTYLNPSLNGALYTVTEDRTMDIPSEISI